MMHVVGCRCVRLELETPFVYLALRTDLIRFLGGEMYKPSAVETPATVLPSTASAQISERAETMYSSRLVWGYDSSGGYVISLVGLFQLSRAEYQAGILTWAEYHRNKACLFR